MERNWLYVFILVHASSMYIQYKLNVSENQLDTLKDAIQLKKGATLCFPKGGIRGDISDGTGLLIEKNSPFKNIPVLGWLL